MNGRFDDSSPDMVPEEDWEREVAALLAELPPVEPPVGFIDLALDHRPLFALRALAGLTATAAVAFVVSFALGAFGAPLVVPELNALAAQHALVGSPDFTDRSQEVDGFLVVDEDAGAPLETSGELDLRATLIAEEDLRQAVYARQGESVSIFSQPGRVDYDDLPPGDRVMIDGVLAWVSPDDDVVVLEAAESAVTIIGLSSREVEAAIEDIPRQSRVDGLAGVVNAITRELGFPDLD